MAFLENVVPKKSFFCCIRCCSYFQQQILHMYLRLISLENCNTPTHLENNSPSKKIPSIISVTMTLNLCFYHQLCVKWACIHVYRLEINLGILDKLIQVSLNVWGCLTPNEMHIELVSFIIWLK